MQFFEMNSFQKRMYLQLLAPIITDPQCNEFIHILYTTK